MKLTNKGMNKVENCIWCDFDGYNEYDTQRCLKKEEFTQEDFKDCVVLTVDEAKELLQGFSNGLISNIAFWIENNVPKFSKLLKERIEQAENNYDNNSRDSKSIL